MKKLIIAGTHSSVGKTTITCGILRVLSNMGYDVSAYKIGADYIDTSYHKLATKNISTNLDEFMLDKNTIKKIFMENARDISVVEGVMGLFDGYQDMSDYCSTSSMAKILKTNVILIIDASKMASSIAAVVKGYLQYDKDVKIKGIILNNVSTQNHYNILKSSIEKVSNVKILGKIPKINDIGISSRHLGLKLAQEDAEIEEKIEKMAHIIKENIDMDMLLNISNSDELSYEQDYDIKKYDLKLAIAKDKAFNFYYESSLDELRKRGVELVEFNTFLDEKLPNCDGVYIGGGYPELYVQDLSKNKSLLKDIKEKSKKNLPIYAECGGLMYLGDDIQIDDKVFDMVGIFNGTSIMKDRLQKFGYCVAVSNVDTILTKKNDILKGHEFHHSTFESSMKNCFDMQKKLYDKSIREWLGGYTKNNTLASYLHIHFSSNKKIVDNFCDSMEEYKKMFK